MLRVQSDGSVTFHVWTTVTGFTFVNSGPGKVSAGTFAHVAGTYDAATGHLCVYVDGEGVQLQIQRKEGGVWADFPVLATGRGGAFETWIQTSHTGRQLFRDFDPQADRASQAVAVTVG